MGALIPFAMIANHFLNVNISSIILISCQAISKDAKMLKHLSSRGIAMSHVIDSLSPLEVRRTGVAIDLSCNSSVNILEKMSSEKMFGLETEWLLISGAQDPQDVGLPDLYILPGSSVTLTCPSVENNSIRFYDLYRITRRLPYKFALLGELPVSEENLPKWSRPSRTNYETNLLTTVSVIHSLNRSKLTDPEVAEEDRWPAIHYPVVVNIADQLNFVFDLKLESRHGWKFPNGSFEGMVGVMEREEVDFGASGVIMREDRRQYLDYTVDYFEFKTGIIFIQPSLSSVSNIYLLPFSRHVWFACAGFLVLVLLILCIELKRRNFDPPGSILDMVNIVLGFVCQQGSYLAPLTISGRIVVFVSSLAALFLYTSYSANIVALLQSTSSVLKTLNDLSHSHLGLKVQINEYHLGYFLEAIDQDVKILYEKKVKTQKEAFVNGTRGVQFMRTGDFAFCVEFDLAYKQISKTFQEEEKCGLGEMHLFFVPRLSIPVIKRSGHREHFTQMIIWQRESGMLDRISRIWLARRPRCESKGAGYLKVGLKDFFPALKVILVGLAASMTLFVGELVYISVPENIVNDTKLLRSHAATAATATASCEKVHALKKMSAVGMQVSFSESATLSRDPHRLGSVLDLRCPDLDGFITKLTSERLLNTHHEWIFLDEIPVAPQDVQEGSLPVPVQTEALDKIKDVYMLPDSTAIVIQLMGSEAHFFDVYRISMGKPLVFTFMATHPKHGVGYTLPKRPDRSNFENITLNAVTVIYKMDLFTTLDDPDRPDVDAWAKIHYPVAKHLEEQLQFTMNLSISDDYGWEVNGTFNGIMGYFQRGEADIAGTALFMRADRMRLLDFTSVCFDLGSTVIFKQPRLSSVSNIFLLPFSKQVWLAIGVLALSIIVFLGLELFMHQRLSDQPSYSEEHTSVIDIVTFVAGFMCQQGSHILPESLAARIAVFSFSLSVVFFNTSYSANIVALLRSTPPILKTLSDLSASHLDIILEDRKYNIIYFKESTDPVVQHLYAKKVKPHITTAYVPPKVGIAKMRTGEFAYNVDINAGYKWISDTFEEAEKCSLSEIKLFKTEALGMAVAKRSGYKDIIGQKLIWQNENGLYDKIKAQWIPPKPRCIGDSGGFTSVGITDFLPAILALIYGCSIATFILILESIYKNKVSFQSVCCSNKKVQRGSITAIKRA